MIKKIYAKAEMNAQGLTYTHEQRYGLITSFTIHLIVFMLFLVLSIHKSSNDVKTFYIQFTQMGEQTAQSLSPSREIKKHTVSAASKRYVIEKETDNKIKEEIPLKKELPVKEREKVIKNDATESNDSVKVVSKAVAETKEIQETHGNVLQRGESRGSDISYMSSMSSAGKTPGVVETTFGSRGAPAFLKRQLPVYPMLARRLGKEGKVVLRLFISEKGRLVDVEVVEPASYGFTEAAVEAVRMSTFSPAREKGVSIASKALLAIRFVLKKV